MGGVKIGSNNSRQTKKRAPLFPTTPTDRVVNSGAPKKQGARVILRYPLDFDSLAEEGLYYAFAEALLKEEQDARYIDAKFGRQNFIKNEIITHDRIFKSIKGFPRAPWERLMKKLYREGVLCRTSSNEYRWNTERCEKVKP
jgi:hypothetical protein